MEQIPLTIFSLIAVYCVTGRGALQRWGPIFGLLSQPFWFYATWRAEQWGMFGLSLVYAVMWVRGIYNGWLRPGV